MIMKKTYFWMVLSFCMLLLNACEKTDVLEYKNEVNIELDNPLSEKDSIAEQNKEALFLFSGEKENGMLLTDGKDYVWTLEKDSTTGGQTLQCGKYDAEADKWLADESFVVELDDSMRVVSLTTSELMYAFTNYTETTCDIISVMADRTYEVYEGVKLPESRTVSVSSRGSDETIDAVLNTITGTYSSVQLAKELCENPKTLKAAFAAFDYLTEMMSGGVKFGMTASSMGLQFKLLKAVPNLATLMIELIQSGRTLSQFLTEQLIGNWELELIDVRQVTAHSAKLVFSITGVLDKPILKPTGSVWYKNKNNKDANSISVNVKNDHYEMTLPLTSYGPYTGTVTLSAGWGFFKQENFEFDAYYLGLKGVTVEEDVKYIDGKVRFNMALDLEGDESTFTGINEYGFYITYAGNTPEYHSLKNLNSFVNALPHFHTFAAGREHFFEENIDYENFTAELKDYRIGVYLYNKKKGYIYTADEQPLTGLVYQRKPSMSIVDVQMTDNGVRADGTYDRYTDYQVKFKLDGGFFYDKLYSKYGNNWTTPGNSYLLTNGVNDDEVFTIGNKVQYSSKNHNPSYISYYAVLTNGGTVQFSDMLCFQDGNMSKTSGGESGVSRALSTGCQPMMVQK